MQPPPRPHHPPHAPPHPPDRDPPAWMRLAARVRHPQPSAALQADRGELTALAELAAQPIDRARVALLALAMQQWHIGLSTLPCGDEAQQPAVVLAHAVQQWALGDRDTAVLLLRRLDPSLAAQRPPAVHLALATAQLLQALGEAPLAAAWLEAVGQGEVPPRAQPDLARQLARLAGRLRDARLASLATAHAPADLSERHAVEIGRALIEAGAFQLAEQWLHHHRERGPQVQLLAVELLCWQGRWRAALDQLRDLPQRAEGLRLRGVAELGLGDAERALHHLDAALHGGDDSASLQVHRGEALLALGNLDGAEAAARRALQQQNLFCARVLLAEARLRQPQRWSRLERRSRSALFDGPLLEEFALFLQCLNLPPPVDAAQAWAEACRHIRAAMGGNRSARPTYLDRAGELQWFTARNAREASAATLVSLHHRPLSEVLAQMQALIAERPDSPHPSAYAGELQLWLGDLDRAAALFAQAQRILPCRWACVGTSAVHLLRGQPLRAAAWAWYGRKRFGELRVATTHVYGGELARRRGDLQAARRDLEIAVAAKPTRVAAWMNLALVYAGLGLDDPRDQTLRRVEQLAPAVIWLATQALGQPPEVVLRAETAAVVLEQALRMMRGNRSSIVHTLFVGAQLRVLPPPSEVVDVARTVMGALLDDARAWAQRG